MKLLHLDPRWRADGVDRFGMGLTFECPCQLCGRRITVWFANPIDHGEPVRQNDGVWLFHREGISFDFLTALPGREPPPGAHWWGCIVNGEVE